VSVGRLVEGSRTSRGLEVVWSVQSAVAEVLEGMLGGGRAAEASPASPAHDNPTSAEGHERIALDFSDIGERTPYGAPVGFEWSFYQGRIVAYAGPTEFSFQDDASEVRVPLGAGPIVGRLHPSSLEDRSSLRLLLDLALTMALRARRIFHLHAAGVVRGDTCLLLPGESGAGKTSSALALVAAGWSYLADDSVFLRARGEGLDSVVAQRREFHLTPTTLAAYPALAAFAARMTEPAKMCVAPERAFPGRFRDAAPPPRLLLFPTVVDSAMSTAEPITDAIAFGNLLMASTMLSVPGTPHTNAHLALLKDIVEGADCFELRLGGDFLRSPAAAVEAAVEPLVARTARGARFA
jgi:hypothetical protein